MERSDVLLYGYRFKPGVSEVTNEQTSCSNDAKLRANLFQYILYHRSLRLDCSACLHDQFFAVSFWLYLIRKKNFAQRRQIDRAGPPLGHVGLGTVLLL